MTPGNFEGSAKFSSNQRGEADFDRRALAIAQKADSP